MPESKKAKPTKPSSSFNFAERMLELEDITSYLESDETDLDDALAKFKRGTVLVQELEAHLKTAKSTISTIQNSVDKSDES